MFRDESVAVTGLLVVVVLWVNVDDLSELEAMKAQLNSSCLIAFCFL